MMCAAAQEAVPSVGPKAVNVTNAVYQRLDLAPVMKRLVALAQTNIVGAFPGGNPYGFQADPNTFCLFAIPKAGAGPAVDPSQQLTSWLARAGGKLPTLPGLQSFLAQLPPGAPGSGVVGADVNGQHYACTPYQPATAAVAAPAAGPSGSTALSGAAAAAALAPDAYVDSASGSGFPSNEAQPLDVQPAQPAAASPELAASSLASAAYLKSFRAAAGPAAGPAMDDAELAALLAAAAPAAGPSAGGYEGTSGLAGGYGGGGVKRPPIAYYNAATGGVVVTPPKSLFVSFGQGLDKVMQVRARARRLLGMHACSLRPLNARQRRGQVAQQRSSRRDAARGSARGWSAQPCI
jgi:hypothetical protein